MIEGPGVLAFLALAHTGFSSSKAAAKVELELATAAMLTFLTLLLDDLSPDAGLRVTTV
jgi:hypothetical protein